MLAVATIYTAPRFSSILAPLAGSALAMVSLVTIGMIGIMAAAMTM